ncbi:hypothetical protein [Allorhodopirellula solitaria]|uniref:DUF1269 domain-containing protein n=1 Tax=Allorhodopirellula solitaria TaxID=2527987 RepID=A0A5C5YG09_9BACT|nr:hypothetical protein [Allorhodopirellula solitaria]TWT74064.1 hypothetical protein CA85_09500 [Allorhodopirellula solitaria]
MKAACLVAEYESQQEAEVGMEVLRKSDFKADAVSVAWKGHTRALDKVDRRPDDPNDVDVKTSAEIGAGIGALVGTPLAIGSVIGPIMVAGPLASLIGGAALGAVVSEAGEEDNPQRDGTDGADSRGLYAMANHYEINSHSAAEYEQRIHDGAILVIVASTPPRLDEAQRSLKTTGPASLQRFEYRQSDQVAP